MGRGTASEHLNVLELVEVLLGPAQEFTRHLVLLVIEQLVREIELPKRRAATSRGVEVVLELLGSRRVRRHTGARLAVHRIVVVDMGERELELVIFDEVVVVGVARVELAVHLAIGLVVVALASASLVRTALQPHGVGPLQVPGRRVDVAGQRDPEVLYIRSRFGRADANHKVDPRLPQVGDVVHLVLAADHVVSRAGGQRVSCAPGVVLLLLGEAVELPVVHAILLLLVYKELLEFLDVGAVGNVDVSPLAVRLGALAALLKNVRQLHLVVVAAAGAKPHAEVRAQRLDQLA